MPRGRALSEQSKGRPGVPKERKYFFNCSSKFEASKFFPPSRERSFVKQPSGVVAESRRWRGFGFLHTAHLLSSPSDRSLLLPGHTFRNTPGKLRRTDHAPMGHAYAYPQTRYSSTLYADENKTYCPPCFGETGPPALRLAQAAETGYSGSPPPRAAQAALGGR